MITHKKQFLLWLRNWEKKISKSRFKESFIGSRKYNHFDVRISISNIKSSYLRSQFTSEKNIEKWEFFPFIKNPKRIRKYRFGSNFKQEVSHRDQKIFSHIKCRPIMYASHKDACLYSLFNFFLEQPFEEMLKKEGIEESVIAYRSGLGNNVDFAKKAFGYAASQKEFGCLLVDVSGFFDNIPHKELEEAIEKVLGQNLSSAMKHILGSLTNYRYINYDELILELKRNKRPYFVHRGKKDNRICTIDDYNKYINNSNLVHKNKKPFGIPQGSPASGLLANIYLFEFDLVIRKSISSKTPNLYQRYSDDILIICPVEELVGIYSLIKAELKLRKLNISEEKLEAFIVRDGKIANITKNLESKSTSRRQNLQYLGLEWNGKNIVLRPSTIARRFRPASPLTSVYWRYNKGAINKIDDPSMRRQFQRFRRTIKKVPQKEESKEIAC